jgi:hypothetical protein
MTHVGRLTDVLACKDTQYDGVAVRQLVADLVLHGLPDLSEPDSSRRGWAGKRSMRLTMRRTALALRRLGAALRQTVVLVSGAERYEGLVVT